MPRARPPQARDWMVDVSIFWNESMWKTVEKPSISFSNSGRIASGVTSRPVKPVPPVVITTSMAGSAIQPSTLARMCGDVVFDDGAVGDRDGRRP